MCLGVRAVLAYGKRANADKNHIKKKRSSVTSFLPYLFVLGREKLNIKVAWVVRKAVISYTCDFGFTPILLFPLYLEDLVNRHRKHSSLRLTFQTKLTVYTFKNLVSNAIWRQNSNNFLFLIKLCISVSLYNFS